MTQEKLDPGVSFFVLDQVILKAKTTLKNFQFCDNSVWI